MFTATRCASFSGVALAFLIVVPALLSADPEGGAAIRRRARKVISSGRYQKDLDLKSYFDNVRTPRFDSGDPSSDARARPSDSPIRSRRDGGGLQLDPGALGGVATVILYMILAVVVVLLIIWVARVLGEKSWIREPSSPRPVRRGMEKQRGTTASRPVADHPVDCLQEADCLAASGNYDEAIHLILLGAIQHLSRTASFVSKDSFTSRELAAELRVDEPRKRAFRDLVLAVEESIFRGRRMTEARFGLCRDHFETLLQGESA